MSKESQNRDTDSGRQGEGEILCKQRGLEDNRIKAMNCWTTCSHEDWRHKRCLIQLCNAGNNAVLSGKRQRPEGEVGASDDDTAGWQHQPDGHELGQTLGDGEGQGHLVSMGVTKSRAQLGGWTTAHLCMKSSLGISSFLEEIATLSHSVVFLFF